MNLFNYTTPVETYVKCIMCHCYINTNFEGGGGSLKELTLEKSQNYEKNNIRLKIMR